MRKLAVCIVLCIGALAVCIAIYQYEHSFKTTPIPSGTTFEFSAKASAFLGVDLGTPMRVDLHEYELVYEFIIIKSFASI